MKISVFLFSLATSLTLTMSGAQPVSETATTPGPAVTALLNRPDTPQKAGEQAARLVALMTPEERFAMATGGNSFGISGVPRLGVPPLHFADATAGIRIIKKTPTEIYEKTTAFPSAVLLASTWDREMAHEYARAIGEEMRAGGIHFLLGPGGSVYRLSRSGRNFEYFGEDPYLSAQIVEHYVKGLQSTGVAATMKPYVANETEFYRRNSNSIVDERTLHEIYLPPYKAGVDAGSWAVMTSYNQLNGEWTGQSDYAINVLLRGKLGFKWLCMTDWTSTWDGVKLASSGQDLEKPNGFSLVRDRVKLLGSPQIDRMATSILKTCIAAGLYAEDFRRPELMGRWAEREAVARRANERGIILLQNNGILPLAVSNYKSGYILIAGTNSARKELSGRGSGHVAGFNNKTYVEAATETFAAKIVATEKPTDDEIKGAALVLLFPGYPLKGKPAEAEGTDRPFEMPDDALIQKCARLNKKTVVCITTGGGVAMEWAPDAPAILQASYGGQSGAAVLMDIITGKVNPSGKLPYTIEKRFEDSPAFGYDKLPLVISQTYPAKTFSLDKLLLLNDDKTLGYVYDLPYKEGVFVGYRWYDEKKIEPKFPFGHGLSYTTFEYKDLVVKKQADGEVSVSFTLKNTGRREGAEVAQVYVHDSESIEPRPPIELKGFARVGLKPGESRRVTINLGPDAFSYWSPKTGDWLLESGEFEIRVGGSSRELPLRASVKM